MIYEILASCEHEAIIELFMEMPLLSIEEPMSKLSNIILKFTCFPADMTEVELIEGIARWELL